MASTFNNVWGNIYSTLLNAKIVIGKSYEDNDLMRLLARSSNKNADLEKVIPRSSPCAAPTALMTCWPTPTSALHRATAHSCTQRMFGAPTFYYILY